MENKKWHEIENWSLNDILKFLWAVKIKLVATVFVSVSIAISYVYISPPTNKVSIFIEVADDDIFSEFQYINKIFKKQDFKTLISSNMILSIVQSNLDNILNEIKELEEKSEEIPIMGESSAKDMQHLTQLPVSINIKKLKNNVKTLEISVTSNMSQIEIKENLKLLATEAIRRAGPILFDRVIAAKNYEKFLINVDKNFYDNLLSGKSNYNKYFKILMDKRKGNTYTFEDKYVLDIIKSAANHEKNLFQINLFKDYLKNHNINEWFTTYEQVTKITKIKLITISSAIIGLIFGVLLAFFQAVNIKTYTK